ncbi:PspC domain-containing protein [Blastococcus sp. SYSU D00695]
MTAAPPPAPPTVDPPGAVPPSMPPSGTTPPVRPPLRRSRTDKMAGGVAGGLAEYSGIDPLLWRVGFVALTLAGGTGILVYLLLWVLTPAGPPGAEPPGTGSAAPTLPRSPVGRLTLAGVLIVLGVLVLVARLTDWEPGPRPFLGVALLVVGLGLVAGAFVPGRAPRGGLIALGVVLSLGLALASSVPWASGAGVGDRDYRPATVGQVRDVYRLGAGDLTVDLSRVDVSDLDAPLRVEIDHGVGDLDVVVPRDADVRLTLDTGVGEEQVFDGGSSDGGFFPGTGPGRHVDDGDPEFVLVVDHGVGDTEVSRG